MLTVKKEDERAGIEFEGKQSAIPLFLIREFQQLLHIMLTRVDAEYRRVGGCGGPAAAKRA